jgi:tripartite-type tricarboxylate transporter receptor subunit TctC
MLSRRSACLMLAASWVLPGVSPAVASDFPTKPIRLVVPFGPGTGSDVLARIVAQQLSVEIGQSVVVENRPGASGGIGTREVAKAAPDGYSLVMGTNATLITTPTLNPEMNYRADTDLTPVATLARCPMVLVTGATPDSPKTVSDLIASLKAKRRTFGSPGVGTIGHIAAELMLKDTGTSATLITYKSSSESLTDVARGENAFAIDSPAAIMPFVKSGKIRPLAVTGTERLAGFPDIPTLKEAGINTVVYAWFAVLGPKDLPAPITNVLSDKIAAVIRHEEVQTRLRTMSLDPFVLSASEFKTFLSKDIEEFGGFIRTSGITMPK